MCLDDGEVPLATREEVAAGMVCLESLSGRGKGKQSQLTKHLGQDQEAVGGKTSQQISQDAMRGMKKSDLIS